MKKEKLEIDGKFKKSRSKKLLKWIDLLRKNKRKAKGFLIDNHDGMCCLGVYCHKIAGVPKKKMRKEIMPEDIGIDIPFITDDDLLIKLAEANDDGYSHKQIADWLEENLVRK